MAYKREDITDTSPLGLKKINDNIRNLWSKVFGDINITDCGSDLKQQLYTNWIQPQGEGNMDTSHPLTARFYVPETTKKIKKASLNCIISPYRLDSDVTKNNDDTIAGEGSTLSTSQDSAGTVDKTAPVEKWGPEAVNFGMGTINASMVMPHGPWIQSQGLPSDCTVGDVDHPIYQYAFETEGAGIGTAVAMGYVYPYANGQSVAFTDMIAFQHTHKVFYELPKHGHTFGISLLIKGHYHNLNKAIIDAPDIPININIKVNGNSIGTTMDGLVAQNNISIPLDKILIGAWNTIEVSCTGIGRATIFGVIEALQKYN